jgi:hypothetical protein
MKPDDRNPFDEHYATDIMVLGIGCILFSDEGFGVRVVEKMEKLYEFPENVLLVDGGVLGINLLGGDFKTETFDCGGCHPQQGQARRFIPPGRRRHSRKDPGQKFFASG